MDINTSICPIGQEYAAAIAEVHRERDAAQDDREFDCYAQTGWNCTASTTVTSSAAGVPGSPEAHRPEGRNSRGGSLMYAKVFSMILDSSLADDYQIRHVFEDLLKLADREGVVDMTARAIAGRTNVPLEVVQRALDALEQPDPESRTPDEDGRRIVRLDAHRNWGWRVVNYEKYSAIRDEDSRREYMKSYMRKRRNPDAQPVNSCKQVLLL